MTKRVELGSERRLGGEGLADEVLARLVVMRGLATPREVEECREIQEEGATRGSRLSLDSILLERGVLGRGDLARLLEHQAERIRICPGCDALVETYGGEAEGCPGCGSPLPGKGAGLTRTSLTGVGAPLPPEDDRFHEAETILRERAAPPRDPFGEGPTVVRRRDGAAGPGLPVAPAEGGWDGAETDLHPLRPGMGGSGGGDETRTGVRTRGKPGNGDETATRSPDRGEGAAKILKAVPVSPDDPAGLVGTVIGGCEIASLLGKGGMGAVYRARRLSLKKTVALKLLPQSFCRSPDAVSRFGREARSAGQLRHPNIVQVFNVGEDKGYHFIEMEFVDGRSLRDLLEERGRLAPEVLREIMESAARGLEAAHREGVIHRDIKPDNIMITQDGELKITDFGLARATEDSIDVTQEGQVLGTPHYMSPEQCDGKLLDQRSDIYSLGVTFYHMATGRRPFTGDSAVVILRKHLQEAAPPPGEVVPDLPEGICAVIERMMEKDLEKRYAGVAEVILDLERLKLGRKVEGHSAPGGAGPRRGMGWTLPIGLILTLGLAAGVFGHGWITSGPGPEGGDLPSLRVGAGGVDESIPSPPEGVGEAGSEIEGAGSPRGAGEAAPAPVDRGGAGEGLEPEFPGGAEPALRPELTGTARPGGGAELHREEAARVGPAAVTVETAVSDLGRRLGLEWGQRWRRLPGGEYEVGTTESGFNPRTRSELPNPLRKVILGPYGISEFEVTNADYLLFVAAGGYEREEFWSEGGWGRIQGYLAEGTKQRAPRFWPEGRPPEGREAYPVVGVSFQEATAYCAWLSTMHPELEGARLPTEEEWEVAASWDKAGGRKLKYPWGDAWDEGHANINTGEPLPVGSSRFDRSSFGCQDMAGNVREWVTGPEGRPVLRGACFVRMISPESVARCEWHLAPMDLTEFQHRRWDYTGFRVVLPKGATGDPGQGNR